MVVEVQGEHNLGFKCVQFKMLRAMNKTVLRALRGCAPECTPKDTADEPGGATCQQLVLRINNEAPGIVLRSN